MLVIALADLPIGYYTLLRIVVCGVAVGVVLQAVERENRVGLVSFGVIALLYNPIFPIYFQAKETWAVFDLAAASMFIYRAFTIKPKHEKDSAS